MKRDSSRRHRHQMPDHDGETQPGTESDVAARWEERRRHLRRHLSGPPPWIEHGPDWRRKQRGLFWRFAATFGGLLLFISIGMLLLALLFTTLLGGNRQVALL